MAVSTSCVHRQQQHAAYWLTTQHVQMPERSCRQPCACWPPTDRVSAPRCCQPWCRLGSSATPARGGYSGLLHYPHALAACLTLVSVVGLRPGSSRISRLAWANSADRFISSHRQPRPMRASAASTCTSVCKHKGGARAVREQTQAHRRRCTALLNPTQVRVVSHKPQTGMKQTR